MRRLLTIMIVAIILVVVVNDAGKWAQATIDLHNSSGQVLEQVTLGARGKQQAQLADQLAAQAAIQQIRVTQYALSASTIKIWAEEDVRGTWILGPYLAVSRGVPFSKAWSTPFTIHYETEAAYR